MTEATMEPVSVAANRNPRLTAERDEAWHRNVAKWGAVLKEAFPKTHRITRLQVARYIATELDAVARLAALREALEPFAFYAEFVASEHPGWDHDDFIVELPGKTLSLRAFRLARAALE